MTDWRTDFNKDSGFRRQVDSLLEGIHNSQRATGLSKYGPDFDGDPILHAIGEIVGLELYLAAEVVRRSAQPVGVREAVNALLPQGYELDPNREPDIRFASGEIWGEISFSFVPAAALAPAAQTPVDAAPAEPLRLCFPHLYLRKIAGDYPSGLIELGSEHVEGECVDCDAVEAGTLEERWSAENVWPPERLSATMRKPASATEPKLHTGRVIRTVSLEEQVAARATSAGDGARVSELENALRTVVDVLRSNAARNQQVYAALDIARNALEARDD